MRDPIRDIFESITEHHRVPIRLGSRCESEVYYHVANLASSDLEICARYVARRVLNVCQPHFPDLIANLRSGYTGFAELLAVEIRTAEEPVEVLHLDRLDPNNGLRTRLKHSNVILVDDVITTARSCLEAHAHITMNGGNVLCWAALVDRTLGPGPVSVVAAYTGAPVRLVE